MAPNIRDLILEKVMKVEQFVAPFSCCLVDRETVFYIQREKHNPRCQNAKPQLRAQ